MAGVSVESWIRNLVLLKTRRVTEGIFGHDHFEAVSLGVAVGWKFEEYSGNALRHHSRHLMGARHQEFFGCFELRR
ncbi:hypothetical protein TNCV_2850791 [Trichonephila clavipes]|nr:hypothetical protein TNCV_2850791 [Trichonephila clavipes]